MEFVDQMPKSGGRGRKRDPRFDEAIEKISTGRATKFVQDLDFPNSSRASFRYTLKQRLSEKGLKVITRTVKSEPDALYVLLVTDEDTATDKKK